MSEAYTKISVDFQMPPSSKADLKKKECLSRIVVKLPC